MVQQQTYTESRLIGTLNDIPEILVGLTKQDGNIAFNIAKYGDSYRFQIGLRKDDSFVVLAEPNSEPIPSGKTLNDLADEELARLGTKASVPDVFVESKLYRSASK